jgi:predicted acyl esterase
MRRLLAASPLLLALATAPVSPARAADATVTKTTVHIDTTVGPTGTTHCDVVGDLYKPDTATAATPAPVILTTNGFGGSKEDQAGTGDAFAKRGYVVLSYSGLGFGGSGCNIELDDRDWDGKAAQDIVTWLAALDYVKKDAPGDPRIGMIGGSYGGQVQFAAAAVDPRIDTLVPIITWHDLAYSLAPNNRALGAQPPGLTPGVPKQEWTELFFALGMSQPAQHPDTTPVPPSTCPGFDPRVCPANATTAALGYPTADTLALLRHASVTTFLDAVKVPTLLAQGEADSLFDLNEAAATYLALKARHVPVKLMFQSWGHSHLAPAPGELDLGHPEGTYQGEVFAAWFDKYLKDADVSTGPEFEFFRPWVTYTGSARPAYGSAPHGGQPASYSETSYAQDMEPFASIPPTDPPGQYASFTTPALTGNVEVVGVPTLDVRITDAAGVAADPALLPTVYTKLLDVAPDGSVELVRRLVAPARLDGTSGKVRLYLPGIVHRFAAGHRLRLVVATTDQAYVSSRAAHVLTIANDPAAPNVLTLPVTSKATAGAVPRVLGERQAAAPARGADLPATGLADTLPALAAALVLGAAYLRRRVA